MKPTQPTDRVVVNIKDAAVFKPFVVDGEAHPRQGFVQLDETFPDGAGFHTHRMEPGTSSQPHKHTRVPSRKCRHPCRWHFRHWRDIGDTRMPIG